MFFHGWSGLLRVLVVGTAAYIGLVVLLRVSGKRTLSKLNAFDLVVTVALGSTLASVLLDEQVALAEGLTAFALLVALQAVITALSVRSARFSSFIKAEPTLLAYEGRLLQQALKRQRVTEAEVDAALRTHGCGRLDEVQAVVIETDGSLTVVKRPASGHADTLNGLSNIGQARASAGDD